MWTTIVVLLGSLTWCRRLFQYSLMPFVLSADCHLSQARGSFSDIFFSIHWRTGQFLFSRKYTSSYESRKPARIRQNALSDESEPARICATMREWPALDQSEWTNANGLAHREVDNQISMQCAACDMPAGQTTYERLAGLVCTNRVYLCETWLTLLPRAYLAPPKERTSGIWTLIDKLD